MLVTIYLVTIYLVTIYYLLLWLPSIMITFKFYHDHLFDHYRFNWLPFFSLLKSL